MPYKDPEEKKAKDKAYYVKNKERLKRINNAYAKKNKEKRKVYMKTYREENQEKIKAYFQSPQGKKVRRICCWKQQGIISNDWDALYERFITTKNCEECDVELTEDRQNTSTTRCLDHNHDITDSENVRNILCLSCNNKCG